MPKIFLIHGSSIGVKYSFLRGDCVVDGSFEAFGDMIGSGEARLFSWYAKKQEFSFWESINPWSSAKLYLEERNQIKDLASITKLQSAVIEASPEIVIAHSLGCHYLLNYLNTGQLTTTVKHIYLINSEAPHNLAIFHHDIIKRIQNGNLIIHNYFFCWDPTLLSSTLLTGQFCGGILGFRSPYIKNHFKFIPSLGNWHTALVQKNWIRDLVMASIS